VAVGKAGCKFETDGAALVEEDLEELGKTEEVLEKPAGAAPDPKEDKSLAEPFPKCEYPPDEVELTNPAEGNPLAPNPELFASCSNPSPPPPPPPSPPSPLLTALAEKTEDEEEPDLGGPTKL
jgi:hypothetical protein